MAMTTLGEISDDLIDFRRSVTFEDEHIRMERIDKFYQGQWVGNDLHGTVKTGHDLNATQAEIG